jgi:A/G-specific adenine glycosylase
MGFPTDFQRPLTRWFQSHQEKLPWRMTRDPYRIWVSEIMLQQTTVAAVIPYYERFVERFPTVYQLAKADLDDVLSLWSGLGYYSRARNLHKGAQTIAKAWKGKLPQTVESLQNIPGIGRYTAGAIASIAFGQSTPLVDGNVMRVYARLFWIDKDVKKEQKYYWDMAHKVMPSHAPGDFNQGLMELGRRMCTPKNPTCLICPLRSLCQAAQKGKPEELPRRPARKATVPVTMGVALIQSRGRFLMVQRKEKTVLKDMWEFPMLATTKEKFSPTMITKNLDKEFALKTEVIKSLPTLRHSIMNQKITLYPFLCSLDKRPKKQKDWLWVGPEQINHLATSSMNKKVFNKYLAVGVI